MDYFCKECAGKAAWVFDASKAFQHSCQRCFRNIPCNDYSYRKPKVIVEPAPQPKDIVATQVNAQSEVKLPAAKGVPQVPVPVYEVQAPSQVQAAAPCQPPVIPSGPDTRTEIDKALDAVQPNRPGIRIEKIDKMGKRQ